MKSFGSLLFILGVLGIVFNYMNRVPRLLSWIYNWGEGVAWGIKIGLVVIGALLYLSARKKNQTPQPPVS